MRILLPTDGFPPNSGGVGWSSFYLAKALEKEGYEVDVIVPKPEVSGVSTGKYGGMKITYFGYSKGTIPVLKNRNVNEVFWKNFGAFVGNYIDKNRPDIIHAQHQMTIIPSIIAGKARGIPVVSHIRNYWPICYFGTWGFDEDHNCVECIARRSSIAAIPGSPVINYVRKNLEYKKKILSQSDRIISIGLFLQSKLRDHGLDSEYVPNFIDPKELKASDVEVNEPFILFAGNLTEEKGAFFLLKALDRLGTIEALPNPVKTLIVGDGVLERRMRSFVEKRHLNVEFLGRVSHEKVIGLTEKSEAVVFPSLWPEPFGRVIIESMALGKTVIATDFGEPPNIIKDGYDGFIARTSVKDFADRIAYAMNSEDLRKRYGKNAKKAVEEKFSRKVVMRKIKKVYNCL